VAQGLEDNPANRRWALGDARGRPGRLPLHSRRVDVEHPRGLDEISVDCPVQHEAIPIDECVGCPAYQGLSLGSTGEASWLLCRRATPKISDVLTQVGSYTWKSSHPGPAPADYVTVGTMMTRKVVCVEPDLPVTELTELLLDLGIGGVPVLDDAGQAIGVVTRSDLLRALLTRERAAQDEKAASPAGSVAAAGAQTDDAQRPATVGDIMMPAVFTLPENASVAKAAALMSYEGVHRLVILSDADEVVGILSALDILRWMAQQGGYSVPPYTQTQRHGG
jgi:CBS domain-containing protein